MNSFSSELGVQFGTSLEAPHVIDVESQVQMDFSYFLVCRFLQLLNFDLSITVLQVWPAIISSGPGNYPLNGSYKTADGYAFQVFLEFHDCSKLIIGFSGLILVVFLKDALGKSLEEIFLIVPGGCLVFFPSYKLMEKLQNRWSETGQWSRLNARKSLFVGKASLYSLCWYIVFFFVFFYLR